MAFSRWSDFLGRRRTLLIVLTLMLGGTVTCLLAPNLTVLLLGRILQSATSATFTISFLLLSERFSKRLFGISVGVISAVNGGIGGLDGFLGGFITDTIGWQFLFVLVLGVGVLALVLVAVVVPKRSARTREGRMDWWGACTLSTFLILLSNLIGQASTSGWGDAWTLGYLAGAVVAGLAFVAVEKRVARPLIAIEQLRSRQVWPVLASTVLTLAGIFSALNFTVILLSQDAKAGYGLSASMSALLYLTPTAFVGVLTAVFSGWFAQRIGWFKALRISSGLIVVVAVAVAIFAADRWMVFALLIIMGILYLGQFQSTVSGIAVLNSPKSAPGSVPASMERALESEPAWVSPSSHRPSPPEPSPATKLPCGSRLALPSQPLLLPSSSGPFLRAPGRFPPSSSLIPKSASPLTKEQHVHHHTAAVLS
ncbi:MFS transporter [Arthrobacter sp. NA-172]|uniref:MFS transporter n=1 Tax=Arthrobacter sp. NA-172 TaxID=3367524 RepID=UPI00375497F9